MRVGLINFNKRGVHEPGVPPVPPIGLEYLADDLIAAGHEPALLDLCFVDLGERPGAIADFCKDKAFIGLTFRNMGADCLLLKEEQFFVPDLHKVVGEIRQATDAPLVLGGQGYSIFPEKTLAVVGADFGVAGPGERALVHLLANYRSLPRGTVLRAPANAEILHQRALIDYRKYIDRGGSPAVQTRNGCPFPCGFCIEAKKQLYRRKVDNVIAEIEILLAKGTRFIFFADAEFNNHLRQAEAVCDAIIESGLKFDWSCYLNTIPMTPRLAAKMKAAGCVQPCVSVVSGSDETLSAFDTHFTTGDIRRCGRSLNEAGLSFTVDILLGGPGDTLDSVNRTCRLMDEIKPAVVGLNLGIRLYPITPFGCKVARREVETHGKLYGQLDNNDDFYKPLFYLFDRRVGEAFMEVCASDPRYRLFGYQGFGGVNYKAAGADRMLCASDAAP
jgi:radical SAM superfamily enzyme YgiQ (UPF0313 family)